MHDVSSHPAPTVLSAEDARIFSLETATIRGHTLKLLLIDDAPGAAIVDDLRAELLARLPAARRWKQRIVPAPGTATGLAWQDDPDFDIARHVRAVAADRPVDDGELRRIVAAIMAVPLDRTRPLWTMDVVPRLTNGRWAIVWKVHHGLADGVAMMRAGSHLLWTEPPRAPRSAPPAVPAPTTAAAGLRLAKLAGHRGLLLREFRRVWRLSPLAAEVGADRAVAFARCTLDELRTLGKAIAPEVTINDMLLAAVAGALRRWLPGRPGSRAPIKVQVPVSMHPHLGEDDPFGNRDSFLFIRLPVAEGDPVERVRAVSAATHMRKHRDDATAIYALRDVLGRAPARIRQKLQRLVQGPHEYSLNISNVPGPTDPIHVLGRRVDALYSIAELAPHHALRISAVSLCGTLYIGLCADPHVIADLDELAAGIQISLDELRAIVTPRPPGPANPPQVSSLQPRSS